MQMPNAAAAYVSIEFGARAGSYTPVSACASGADAIVQAMRLIRLGEADIVIAGGVETALPADRRQFRPSTDVVQAK
jgi:3-oxoacyl-[acyl-carrier-protein] synthase II